MMVTQVLRMSERSVEWTHFVRPAPCALLASKTDPQGSIGVFVIGRDCIPAPCSHIAGKMAVSHHTIEHRLNGFRIEGK